MKELKGVYVVVFENGVKIGHSNDIKKRIVEYKKPWCYSIETIYYIETQYNKYIEAQIKKMENVFTIENSTEFADIKHLQHILKELKLIRNWRPDKVCLSPNVSKIKVLEPLNPIVSCKNKVERHPAPLPKCTKPSPVRVMFKKDKEGKDVKRNLPWFKRNITETDTNDPW